MEIESINEGPAELTIVVVYKIFDCQIKRTLRFSLQCDFTALSESWIRLCNKEYTTALPESVFWNDASDLSFVFMTTNNAYTYLDNVLHIPFNHCKDAFEKIRDAITQAGILHYTNQLEILKKKIKIQV